MIVLGTSTLSNNIWWWIWAWSCSKKYQGYLRTMNDEERRDIWWSRAKKVQHWISSSELIEENNVFAMIGSVGTPTSLAALPIAQSYGRPFIGAFTGAKFLRDPWNRGTINIRASYIDETAVRRKISLVFAISFTFLISILMITGHGELLD